MIVSGIVPMALLAKNIVAEPVLGVGGNEIDITAD
jgi:hypothetical protein